MSTEKESKINTLLSSQPLGSVLCSSWLVDQGYSLDLQKRYKKSQWFDSIGTGALIRHADDVDYLGRHLCSANSAGSLCSSSG